MATDYISRKDAKDKHCEICEHLNICYQYDGDDCRTYTGRTCIERQCFNNIPAADVRPVPEGGIGEMSDGYHTFNGLYYQRMVLFAALVKAHKDKAWKSRKHEDGEPCFGGGWFIVGIDTPEGSYTYHYEEKDWDLFDCVEMHVAKHWDGHTEENVTRLLSLPDVQPVVRGTWLSYPVLDDMCYQHYSCSVCKRVEAIPHGYDVKKELPFCHCGADMRGGGGNE